MRKLIFVLIIVLALSCKTEQNDKSLLRPFIKSYTELSEDCVDVLRKILEPYEIEDDTIKIDRIYLLEVRLDSSLYLNDDLQNCYFIGVTLKPDLYELLVFNIDLMFGTISTCKILPNEELVINNMVNLFTDLTNLSRFAEFGIPDSIVQHTANIRTMFRQLSWTNRMYGEWQLDPIANEIFSNELFNNIWIFKPKKEFLLLSTHNDTLIVDNIDFQGEILSLVQTGYNFEIVTQTRNKIIIREEDTDEFKYLIRIK